MNILILEDSVERIEQFHSKLFNHSLFFTDDVDTAHSLLRAKGIDVVMLDNDLGEGLKEGRELAKLIQRDFVDGYVYTENIRKIFIHSTNIVAAQYMQNILSRDADVEAISFPVFPLEKLNEVQ
jgi:D-serine dehydratase